MSELEKKFEKVSPEVAAKATRRRFTQAYKEQVLSEADRCTQPGEIGELLRREGLYWSSLRRWRKERREGSLDPKQRGPKPLPNKQELQELARLQRENARLTERLRQAELIIEVQKKVSQMLGIQLPAQSD